MRNMAIALNGGTPALRNAITNLFSSRRWAQWHWIDDFWIVQTPDDYTPKLLQNEIEALPLVGNQTMLVFEFQGRINFWGRAQKAAWDWLKHIGSAK